MNPSLEVLVYSRASLTGALRAGTGVRALGMALGELGTGTRAAPATPPRGPADIMNQRQRGPCARRGRARRQPPENPARADRRGRTAHDGAERRSRHGAERWPSAPPARPGATPSGVPDAASAAAPHGPHPAHAHVRRRDPHAVLAEPELPTAEPKRGLAPGTIEVLVVGPDGAPQPGAEIVLGVMAEHGWPHRAARQDRRRRAAHLPRARVGSKQAYRVNVLHQGAKFSTTPFRLPEELGYQARMMLKRDHHATPG